MVGDILQPTHLLFILVVALLVLGPKRLPEVGRTLGTGLRDFRQAINGESVHDDHPLQAYVEPEPEPDPVPPHGSDGAETTTGGFDLSAEGDANEPATLQPPAASDHLASSSGFASALASSRRQPADGVEPTADDE